MTSVIVALALLTLCVSCIRDLVDRTADNSVSQQRTSLNAQWLLVNEQLDLIPLPSQYLPINIEIPQSVRNEDFVYIFKSLYTL